MAALPLSDMPAERRLLCILQMGPSGPEEARIAHCSGILLGQGHASQNSWGPLTFPLASKCLGTLVFRETRHSLTATNKGKSSF